jgi:hypothetical protein
MYMYYKELHIFEVTSVNLIGNVDNVNKQNILHFMNSHWPT